MGQAASIKNDSKMVMSFPKDLPVALIDVRDTGAVGARILVDPAPHAGKVYEFTGKLTTSAEFAEVFSQVLGQADHLCRHHARAGRTGNEVAQYAGLAVAHLVTIAKLGASRRLLDREHQADRDLVKRPPITTRQFVEDLKAAFV